MKRVLILEPYYGGSHRFFLEGLQIHVAAEYTLFTLPARKWKMRMQLSALWCIKKINELSPRERWFDVVLCSSFVDIAVLRALLTKVNGWNQAARLCLYFHENQFYYPERQADSKSFQFAAINFHSALASDSIAFNSSYNAETFFSGCRKYLQSATEMGLSGTIDLLRGKCCILFPGIDFTAIDRQRKDTESGPPVIVWNHRWEHDKNPDRFFQILNGIASAGIDFRLILLGKTFPNSPPCFAEAKNTFRQRIIHYGYVASYADYVALLRRGQVVVSTALHEFFGIAIIEAVRAGCLPLLPQRLAYPELFTKEHLYRENEFYERLTQAIVQSSRLSAESARRMTDRFSWQNLAPHYSQWLLEDEGQPAARVDRNFS
jgi:glycosyltransferase involved in cell wall biosynthesis